MRGAELRLRERRRRSAHARRRLCAEALGSELLPAAGHVTRRRDEAAAYFTQYCATQPAPRCQSMAYGCGGLYTNLYPCTAVYSC